MCGKLLIRIALDPARRWIRAFLRAPQRIAGASAPARIPDQQAVLYQVAYFAKSFTR